MTDNMIPPPLLPSVIEGRTPGSIYHIVVRTQMGYVALRRVADKVLRIRAERFDRQPMFNPQDAALSGSLARLGFQPSGANGSRVSIVVHTARDVSFLVGVLTHCLVRQEIDHTQYLIQEEPGAAAWQAHVEQHFTNEPVSEDVLETTLDSAAELANASEDEVVITTNPKNPNVN